MIAAVIWVLFSVVAATACGTGKFQSQAGQGHFPGVSGSGSSGFGSDSSGSGSSGSGSSGSGSSGSGSSGSGSSGSGSSGSGSSGSGSSGSGVSGPVSAPLDVVGSPKDNEQTFVRVVIHGKPYTFDVDTGAATSVINSSAANALGLKKVGPPSRVQTVGCSSSSQNVLIDNWSIAGHRMPATTIAAFKIQGAGSKIDGAPLAGNLGSNVMAKFGVMTIDFRSKRLNLGGPPPPGGQTVPVSAKTINGEVIVTINIAVHGINETFALDTGASTTAIDKGTAASLQLPQTGKPFKVGTLACSTTVRPVRITNWSAGVVGLPATQAVASPNGITNISGGEIVGQLGENVMASFGSITVDYGGQTATFG